MRITGVSRVDGAFLILRKTSNPEMSGADIQKDKVRVKQAHLLQGSCPSFAYPSVVSGTG
jgi:hypothetical protein